jgi:hypothetical protein
MDFAAIKGYCLLTASDNHVHLGDVFRELGEDAHLERLCVETLNCKIKKGQE